MARIAAAPFRILGRRRESLENEAAQLRERRKGIGGKDAEVARATAALLEEKASSELGAAERLKAVERGYEKALEAASREHEAQLAAERTQLQADAARAVEEALRTQRRTGGRRRPTQEEGRGAPRAARRAEGGALARIVEARERRLMNMPLLYGRPSRRRAWTRTGSTRLWRSRSGSGPRRL